MMNGGKMVSLCACKNWRFVSQGINVDSNAFKQVMKADANRAFAMLYFMDWSTQNPSPSTAIPTNVCDIVFASNQPTSIDYAELCVALTNWFPVFWLVGEAAKRSLWAFADGATSDNAYLYVHEYFEPIEENK
jgi:hypothetical protein